MMDLPIQFEYNRDYQERDKLLNLKIDWEDRINRIVRFELIRLDVLEQLIIQKYVNPDDTQNIYVYEKLSCRVCVWICGYPQASGL
jgi:hypothetical protein